MLPAGLRPPVYSPLGSIKTPSGLIKPMIPWAGGVIISQSDFKSNSLDLLMNSSLARPKSVILSVLKRRSSDLPSISSRISAAMEEENERKRQDELERKRKLQFEEEKKMRELENQKQRQLEAEQRRQDG